MTESVLNDAVLKQLRENNIISGEEVVIATGDLYYAKNVISNEKRMISLDTINQFHAKNEAITETSKKTLLRG
jgi:uncharacterized protein YqfB (UPF0267 family)|tara:strand:+ start:225 stop:443 length:219 start_codon:yes stop_codon:yes gene_type:complete